MDLLTLLLLALGLSADAFAVAITNGMCSTHLNKKNAVATAFTFGFFQALMPILGYFLGRTFSDFVNRYQHWVALFLLGAIGVNMISEVIKESKHPECMCTLKNIFNFKNLALQGIATSIDALAAGVSLAVLKMNIVQSALLIGGITFFCCLFGVYIGRKFGAFLGVRARLFGGIILIVLGLKIFIQHQMML
ncbi:MAG TPA: manganese efflux pump MntP family protein [Mobilitalea sp.]|nr:manganese efflux pump MntP family protein [Mobilitalea sp.]